MWGVRVVVAVVLLLLPAAAFAQTEKRIALLIGNQGYGSEIGRLANPHNDVALLEKTLASPPSRGTRGSPWLRAMKHL